MRRIAFLALVAGCGSAPVDTWGRDCRDERDPQKRLALVRNIVDSGDERAIPVLIDCLESVRVNRKGPERVENARAIVPNQTAPPELWGLYVLTSQDFGMDTARWKDWYESRQGRFVWDPGSRKFTVK